jgi:hypothetical protein
VLKPVIKVWCLPDNLSQERLENLMRKVLRMMSSAPATNIKEENDFLILFPRDMMTFGLGSEILIEATNFPFAIDKKWLVETLQGILLYEFPSASVQCSIQTS